MFKKVLNLFSGSSSASKKASNKKTKAEDKKIRAGQKGKNLKKNSVPVRKKAEAVDDPQSLIQEAILDAERTLALEEKVAGHDANHLTAVQNAMMIYRQKQESLDDLPLREKAKLRALSEVLFEGDIAKATDKKKKLH